MSLTDVDPRHDRVHEPDPACERWRESYYFQFFDFKHRIGGYHGQGYRPSKGYSGVLNVMWGLDVPTLTATEKGRYEVHDAVHPVGGITWEIVEPLKRWHITFDGRLNSGGTGTAVPVEALVAGGTRGQTPVDASFDLVFERDQPAYLYRPDPRWDGLFDGHIDEVGRVTGTLRMGDKVYEIDGRGSKDHSWGPRDWARPWGWRWVDMLFEEGPELTVWRATFDGRTWLQDGAIYVDGAAHPVTRFAESATFAPRPRADRPDRWEFEIASGKHVIKGRAEILRVVPLLFGIGDGATMWNDRTVFRCELEDGRVGYGSAEFQFRAPKGGEKAPRPLLAEERPA